MSDETYRELTKDEWIDVLMKAGWPKWEAEREYDEVMADAEEEDGYDGP